MMIQYAVKGRSHLESESRTYICMLASHYIVLLLLHVLCLPKLVNIIMIIQLKHNNEFL